MYKCVMKNAREQSDTAIRRQADVKQKSKDTSGWKTQKRTSADGKHRKKDIS